jgi:hypothetical protein
VCRGFLTRRLIDRLLSGPRRFSHVPLPIHKPRLYQSDDIPAFRGRPEMDVRIAFDQHHHIGVLHEENQRVRVPAAQMKMHDATLTKKLVLVLIDARAVVLLRHIIAALNALDNFVQFSP